MAAIIDTKVTAMKGVDMLDPVVQAPQVRPHSSKPLTMAEQMESLEGKVANQSKQFWQFTNYQFACKTSLGEIMRQLAIGMAVDMSQFLFMPNFSGRSQGEEP